jgi:hypothetical protein
VRGASYAGALGFCAGAVPAGIGDTSSSVTDHSSSIALPVKQVDLLPCRIRIQGR